MGGRLLRRLRGDGGFGLVELLIAMVMLNIGLIAIMGTFVTGSQSIRRASRIATASTLADTQMELYRALTYNAIGLDSSTVPTTAPYTTDSAYSASQVPATCSGAAQCNASRDAPGPDHGAYRVDTYIVLRYPTGGRIVKLVTVVVRDSTQLTGSPLARRASSFDQSTGT